MKSELIISVHHNNNEQDKTFVKNAGETENCLFKNKIFRGGVILTPHSFGFSKTMFFERERERERESERERERERDRERERERERESKSHKK